MEYKFRKAKLDDVKFISKVIVEAEKSGGGNAGIGMIFNLSEKEIQDYIVSMLEEEIDGCEFSISSFIIAEYEGEPVAAFGGWIEGENEDNQQSGILKSNLIRFTIPPEKVSSLKTKSSLLKSIQIEREPKTHQLEYAYVDEKHRGQGLTNKIIDQLLINCKKQNPLIKKSQVQVFENNIPAIKVYQRSGYEIKGRFKTDNIEILRYFPFNVKLVMEKQLL